MTTIERGKMTGLGGSEIAAAMGLNRWKTPLRLWAEKTGKLSKDLRNFEAMEIGTELEEFVARKFQQKTGLKLRNDHRTFRHPEHDFIFGHIDRLVLNEDAIFEAKTCSAWLAKEWQDEDVPQEYVIQVMLYMGLTNRKKSYVAVLIGGQKFVWKEVHFDEQLYEKIISSAVDFWNNYVLKEVPPLAVAEDNETLVQMFPESRQEALTFEGQEAEEINHLIEERAGALEAKKEAESACKEIEAKLKQKLGEAEAGETEQYKFTWKTQSRRFPDTKLMKQDGIYEQYTKPSNFRVLRTSQRKGV